MTRSFRTRAAVALAAALFISGLWPALALEPPTKEQLARYKLDGSLPARVARARALGDHKIPPRMRQRLTEKLARLSAARRDDAASPTSAEILAPPSAWQGLPTTGTVKILALLISFSDYPGTTSAATFESRLFGSGTGVLPYDSLTNFYQRSSYGQLNITGQRPRLVPDLLRPEHRRRDGRRPAGPDQGGLEPL